MTKLYESVVTVTLHCMLLVRYVADVCVKFSANDDCRSYISVGEFSGDVCVLS